MSSPEVAVAGRRTGALEGIRIIDLTMWFQGPVASQLLADLGAEVIHFERPQGGDLGRGVRSIKALPVGDWNQYFSVINRNKKSVAVDLNKPRGREIMYRLVERSDVFLSNVTLENLDRWEVTYERLSELNPGLIYVVCTGYGFRGRVTRPSFDLTVQALTGIMARLGEPGQPPIYVGMGSGDAMGGLMAAVGILLALNARRQTGRGQFIDASLYGAQLFLAAPTLQGYLAMGDDFFSKQRSRRDALNPLWNTYPAQDKWLFVCLENSDQNWRLLCQGLDSPELLRDERFSSAEGRRLSRRELVDAIDAIVSQRPAAAWMERWRPLGIPASPINNLKDLSEDPQAWENRYLVTAYCDEVDREVMVRGLPVSFSKTPAQVRSLGPELGQHTEEVLVDTLGYSWDDIVEMKSEGVIL